MTYVQFGDGACLPVDTPAFANNSWTLDGSERA